MYHCVTLTQTWQGSTDTSTQVRLVLASPVAVIRNGKSQDFRSRHGVEHKQMRLLHVGQRQGSGPCYRGRGPLVNEDRTKVANTRRVQERKVGKQRWPSWPGQLLVELSVRPLSTTIFQLDICMDETLQLNSMWWPQQRLGLESGATYI